MRRLRTIFQRIPANLLVALLAAVPGRAQEPPAAKAPLTSSATAPVNAASALTLAAAQRAQDLGLPSVAADIYRQVRDATGANTSAVSMALVTALLDSGQSEEAGKVLAELPEPHGAAWRLRAGLASLQLGQRAAAQAQWDAIRESEVPAADLPWYRFFTGALYDTATPRDLNRANQYYVAAESSAPTELARVRFQLAGELVRLSMLGAPTPEVVEQNRRNYEQYRGTAAGYGFAEQYAAKLDRVGRKTDAVEFLQGVLLTLPRHETAWRDKFNFLLGLIDDYGKKRAGRLALIQLLETGHNAERQRQALQLLAEASREEPARREFKNELTKLITARTPHPALESLYFFRAQLALAEKDYVQAEADANALMKQFPLAPFRVYAFVLLTQAAWEQGRYRVAADMAKSARAAMTPETGVVGTPPAASKPPPVAMPPRLRADLGVLEAEARFRAKDYRSAADAYAALLLERAPELEHLGQLMFQHVIAEIKAGSDDAAKVLDRHERDAAFDVENRWQAEWSLARALQVKDAAGAGEAYRRVSALLAEPATGDAAMQSDLRAKMSWLRTRLAFESGDSAETIRLVDEQLKQPAEIDPALRAEIASTLLLLKARAEFALNREPAALETLKRLRSEYPLKDAAIYSHLIESEYFADQDKIDEARNRLIALSDNAAYKTSPYMPYALYRLALLSERLGRKENLEEANQRIEDLIKSIEDTARTSAATADPTLYFAARMRQGDIFRKLNDFSRAQLAYEDLVNRYAQRADVVLAKLALADCHYVQSSADASTTNAHTEAAQRIYEQLLDRSDAPRDVRVEAGYKLGALLVRQGKLDLAAKVWWTDVVDQFLVNEKAPLEHDAKRPWWLARTLYELGDLQEKRGRLEEAKAAYLMILEASLPFGGASAAVRLQQLGVAGAKAGQ